MKMSYFRYKKNSRIGENMKKLLLIITLCIVVLHADEIYPKWEDAKQFKYNEAVIICLSPKNIKVQVVHKDDDMDKIIFKDRDNKTIKEVDFLNFIKVNKRYFYQDLDFDGVEELLVDVSSTEQSIEFEAYSIKCDKLVPFSLKNIHAFKLNYEDKILLEYTKNEDGRPIINTYCSDGRDGKYYLCDRKSGE